MLDQIYALYTPLIREPDKRDNLSIFWLNVGPYFNIAGVSRRGVLLITAAVLWQRGWSGLFTVYFTARGNRVADNQDAAAVCQPIAARPSLYFRVRNAVKMG